MEQNLPVISRKVWNIVRTMFLVMLRTGIFKGKLMAELNTMFKRWKIAGKAIQNLMFHHSHHRSSAAGSRSPLDSPNEYEFSCSNRTAYPNFHLPFHLNKRRHNHHSRPFSSAHQPRQATEDDLMTMNAVVRTLEMASPNLPCFGKSPMVRQLRITDSPFPLQDFDDDSRIDEAAEKFIMKFYHDLKRQIATPSHES
ncbi:hypothetical protein Adt_00186 [Abeliophyllum distichum]|uniref:Avr9/Cf-9 rapidly elicited protein 146 n=1 Tax=Abeliophyllum distichum TaxID=126358 RepID=A0ABD1VRH8_9LAMI